MIVMSRLHHRLGEDGGALVELAISLPLLLAILVATVDFARVFYLGIELTNAARAGAQYGAYAPGRSSDFTGMTTVVQNSTTTTGISATPTPSRLCQCATNTGVFSPTSPANTCTATCSGGHIVMTVTVSASKNFTTIMGGFIPGLPSTIPMSRTATLRVVN